MNYATGQKAEILRLQPAWSNWPEHPEMPFYPPDRVVRVVPMLQRAPWRPWPWRTWGWPMNIPVYPYEYSDAYGAGQQLEIVGPSPHVHDILAGGYGAGQQLEIVGPSPHVYDVLAGVGATLDVHAAAQVLVDAIHAGAAHSQPPAWRPTLDFQTSFNQAFGALGGIGTSQRPELLKRDGIYGPRTEIALSHVLGGMQQVMAMYGGTTDSATAGAQPLPQLSSIDQAVESLASTLLGFPGVVMLHSDASGRVILVFVQPNMVAPVRSYVDQIRGTWQGFPVAIHFSGPIAQQ